MHRWLILTHARVHVIIVKRCRSMWLTSPIWYSLWHRSTNTPIRVNIRALHAACHQLTQFRRPRRWCWSRVRVSLRCVKCECNGCACAHGRCIICASFACQCAKKHHVLFNCASCCDNATTQHHTASQPCAMHRRQIVSLIMQSLCWCSSLRRV